MPGFYIVIPARLHATRLPKKVLLPLQGKPMIQHVWEKACATGADPEHIFVATDSEQIKNCVLSFGGQALMTSNEHRCGTDRIAEVARLFNWADDAVVVNLQADEPLIVPELLMQVAHLLLQSTQADMATLACPCDEQAMHNPDCVKVVCDQSMRALYFSRAPIPWQRAQVKASHFSLGWLRHLGIYAYRVRTLKALAQVQDCFLEQSECLEQLRALWLGLNIQLSISAVEIAPSVDTHQDFQRVQALMK